MFLRAAVLLFFDYQRVQVLAHYSHWCSLRASASRHLVRQRSSAIREEALAPRPLCTVVPRCLGVPKDWYC